MAREDTATGTIYYGKTTDDDFLDVSEAIEKIVPHESRKASLWGRFNPHNAFLKYTFMDSTHNIFRIGESTSEDPLYYNAFVASSGDVYFAITTNADYGSEFKDWEPYSGYVNRDPTSWADSNVWLPQSGGQGDSGPNSAGTEYKSNFVGGVIVKTIDISATATSDSATTGCGFLMAFPPTSSSYIAGRMVLYGADVPSDTTGLTLKIDTGYAQCPWTSWISNVKDSYVGKLTVLGPIWTASTSQITRYARFLAAPSTVYTPGDYDISGGQFRYIANGLFLSGEATET